MFFQFYKKNDQHNIKPPTERCFELHECFAKTYNDGDKYNLPGRDVFSHCLIVGHVTRALLARMPAWLRSSLYPEHSELVAASHDVGKVSPDFQEKIRRGRNHSANYKSNSYPGLESADPDREKRWGYHAGLSQVTLDHCQSGRFIPEIVGQHHGYSPSKGQIGICSATAKCYGGPGWQSLREILIEQLKASLHADWPVIRDEKQARVLAGLTTVADWLGSTSRFDDPKNDRWQADVETAVNEAGFFSLEIIKGLTFEDIFRCTPRPAQQNLITACRTQGVYILEAPMGIGKTEAALYAAYKMLESEQASGIYFALPTQLTSDKIFERINLFLDKIVPADCPNRTAILAHANAKLKIMELGEEGAPGGSWFSNHKRELLSTFGVGTIDQALMSVLNVKHGFVRAFGLAGKVVILDEIHSYDAYTGTIIDALVEHLVAWKCTVIILSATLTKERRNKLLGVGTQPLANHYPLITLKTGNQVVEVEVSPDRDTAVKIHLCHATRSAIEEVLKRAEQGQQILWIENTVHDAQEVYKEIAAIGSDCGITCGLLHSRFLRTHRNQIESSWIDLFGTDRSKRLKQGRILIGTQILEQSLDIDADFLVTRLCPTDMLLQRLGRLWRHKTLVRSRKATQEAWILSPSLDVAFADPENPEKAFGKSYFVYSPYYLFRTLQLFIRRSGADLYLPRDIRELIESTYEEQEEEGILRKLKRDLEQAKAKLQRLAHVGLSEGCTTQSDDWAPTRYSEQETCEVLIVRKIQYEQHGISLTLVNNETLFLPTTNPSLKERKELALTLSRNIVKVAQNKAPPLPSRKVLKAFEKYLYVDDENPTLRIVKLSPSDELLSLDNVSFAKKLNYDPILGYYCEE